MRPSIYKGVILFFSVALCFSVENWLRSEQEMQAVTAANESLRKTLGKLIVAISEKDREIDRLSGPSCDVGDPVKPLIPAPKSRGL
jgi:hypothetical protein